MNLKIISEIGKNWIVSEKQDDYLGVAKKLIIESKNAGADLVKIQVHVLEDEKKKRYPSRYEWIKRNEEITTERFLQDIFSYAKELSIEIFGTPMSFLAAKKLNPFVKRWKVGSADITDFELLTYLKETKKPVIISTGMSTEEQIDKAVEFLGDQIEFILHCVSEYPTLDEGINLNTIQFLKEKYPQLKVGFSDHTLSTDIPIYAVFCGAELVEKHFTLDRSAFGPDHKVSLLPNEFREMVDKINKLPIILGKKEKILTEKEKEFWSKFRLK